VSHNPQDPSAVILSQLGRLMFFDVSLSRPESSLVRLVMIHAMAYGPPPGKAIAYGGKDMQQPGTRAIPSTALPAWRAQFSEQHRFVDGDLGPVGGFTWDGRVDSLSAQAKIPLLAPHEMANADAADVSGKVSKAAYAAQFRAAFGSHIFDNPQRAFEASRARWRLSNRNRPSSIPTTAATTPTCEATSN